MWTGAISRSGNVNMSTDLGWESLASRRERSKLNLMFKIVHFIAPDYLVNRLPRRPRSKLSSIKLRSVNSLFTPRCRTVKYSKSYFPTAIKSWNAIKDNIKSADSIEKFKLLLNRNDVFVDQRSLVYNSLSGFYFICLTRIRLGLSGLQGPLFCPSCSTAEESSCHYFFYCALFSELRRVFIEKVKI